MAVRRGAFSWSRSGGPGGGGGAIQANGTSRHIQHSPGTPTAGLRERGNDTRRSTGRSGRQNAAPRRNMRREGRVTVQAPVEEQQPDGMSHGGVYRGYTPPPPPAVCLSVSHPPVVFVLHSL